MQSNEVQNLLFQLRAVQFAITIGVSCLGIAFTAYRFYAKSEKQRRKERLDNALKMIKMINDNLSEDHADLVVQVAHLWDIVRKTEVQAAELVIGLSKEIRRIDEKCEIICGVKKNVGGS